MPTVRSLLVVFLALSSVSFAGELSSRPVRHTQSRAKTPPPPIAAAQIHQHRNPAKPIAPLAGQPFDDAELAAYLEQEGRKVMKERKLPALSFERRSCTLNLPPVSTAPVTPAQIASRAETATVVIGEFFRCQDCRKIEFNSSATGFVLSESGAIATSLHVANGEDTRALVAMLRDGRVFPVVSCLAADPVDDIAILQLDIPKDTALPTLPIAAEPAPMGTPVTVLSHPDGHHYLLTTGVVGRQTIWRGPKGEEHFLSITADFAKGSSGAPVLDDRGNVIGLVNNTESIYYDQQDGGQIDLQMVIKNATPSWVLRRMINPVTPGPVVSAASR